MLRIESYLPRLYEQRQEAAQRLKELDRLIHDEEIEASRIRGNVRAKPCRPDRRGREMASPRPRFSAWWRAKTPANRCVLGR